MAVFLRSKLNWAFWTAAELEFFMLKELLLPMDWLETRAFWNKFLWSLPFESLKNDLLAELFLLVQGAYC